jgi:hypothetical protein
MRNISVEGCGKRVVALGWCPGALRTLGEIVTKKPMTYETLTRDFLV